MSEAQLALRPLLSSLISRVAGRDPEQDWTDDPTALDLADAPVEDLVAAKHTMTQLRVALSKISQHIDRLIAQDVYRNGSIRLGDTVYCPSMTSERRLLPGQGAALVEFLGPDLGRCVNPNTVRITDVRAVAEERGIDADLIEQTFYEHTILTEPELAPVPVMKRKWAQQLKDGERLPPKEKP